MDSNSQILMNLAKEFLVARKTAKKLPKQSVLYVHDVVKRVFKHHLNRPFEEDTSAVIKLFKRAGFPIRVIPGEFVGRGAAGMMPSTYIGVESKELLLLRNSCGKPPHGTSETKKEELEKLSQKLKAFGERFDFE